MSDMSSNQQRNINLFFWIIIGIGILLFLIPRLENYLVQMTAKPQVITARGDLSEQKKAI